MTCKTVAKVAVVNLNIHTTYSQALNIYIEAPNYRAVY